jgi:hypothetical protein
MKAEPNRPRARTCTCGARYETEAFAKLPPVRTLEAAELATFMVAWPTTMAVEVRTCAACDAPLAWLAARSGATSPSPRPR